MKAALLIIDMQKHCIESIGKDQRFFRAVDRINGVSALFRERGHAVVRIQDVEGMEDDPDNPSIAIVSEIEHGKGDLFLRKVYSNAFWKTELEAILRSLGVEFVVASGYCAEHCVLFTYQGALERGFHAAILQKGILSPNPDEIAVIYRDREIISQSALECFL